MDGIRQHKEMAMTGKVEGGGSFGVEPFSQANGGGPSMKGDRRVSTPHGEQSALLSDGERGIGKHVSRGAGSMPAQRHPDHGPHDHRPETGAFGVEKMSSVQG